MSFSYGLQALHPASAANKPHIAGYQTARTVADDPILELWYGSTNATRVLRVNLDGQMQGAAGTVGAPTWSFVDDKDCGVYRIGANNLGVAVNGAKVLDIATTGLSVTGTLTVSSHVIVGDDDEIRFGAAPDYWAVYDSTATAFEFYSSDVDGAGADGVVFKVEDGTDDVNFTGTITLGSALAVTSGGTGLATFTQGDVLYASASNTLAALAKGADGALLRIGATIPAWTTATFPATVATGGLLYGAATNVWNELAHPGAANYVLTTTSSTGTAWTNGLTNDHISASAAIVASKIAAGTFGAGTYSFAGSTISDLGIVTTVDLNGGTVDGVTIGGAAAGAGTFSALTSTGAVTVSTINGIDVNPGSDVDADLLTVGVTGAPRLWWDESDDRFTLTHGLDLDAGALNASNGGALTGTWSSLGTVTTVDINGGTLDGVTIGGAAAAAATVTTLLTSGLLSMAAGSLHTASVSSPGDASIYRNSATGLTMQAIAGSIYDWSLIDPGNNNYIARVPTGTRTFELVGLLQTLASATGSAGLNIPHGTAPTTPVNGDMWTTTTAAYVRINGTTKEFAFV